MKKQLFFAFKDIKRNKKMVTFFIFQMTLSMFFIFICIFQLIDIKKFKMLAERVDKFEPTYFKSYYNEEILTIDTNMIELLEDLINKNPRAYTFFSSGSREYPNLGVYIVFGKFIDVFDLKPQEVDEITGTQAFIGCNVSNLKVEDYINVLFEFDKQEMVKITGRMSNGASYLPTSSYMYNLDNSVIVFTNKKIDLINFTSFTFERLISNVCILGYDEKDVENFVKEVSKTKGLYMLPQNFSEILNSKYSRIIESNIFFLILFVFIFLFTFIGIITNVMNLLNRNLREYAINVLFGSRMGQIYLRIIIYISFLIITPFLITLFFMKFMQIVAYMSTIYYFILFSIAIVSILLISLFPILRLSKIDLNLSLRRDS